VKNTGFIRAKITTIFLRHWLELKRKSLTRQEWDEVVQKRGTPRFCFTVWHIHKS
jgi:hypothetical protein